MINTNNPSFQEFIFSDERFHKLKRHVLFWMVVGAAYFYQSLIPVSNPFRSAVVSLFCFFPTCVLLAYGFMRFLWTALSRKAYFSAILWFSFLSAVAFGINYFTSFRYFQLTCNCDPTTIQPTQCVGLAIGNTFNAITIGVLVLGIKFTKELLLRQKENQMLIKIKLAQELQFQKARIYPHFLFKSLNRLHDCILERSPDAPEALVRLSDLLSYLLYDCTEDNVTVEKEIAMIKDLLAIEQLNQDGRFVIHSDLNVDEERLTIKPLILFPILHHCFETIGDRSGELFRFHVKVLLVKPMLLFTMAIEKLSGTTPIEWKGILDAVKDKIVLDDENYQLDLEDNYSSLIVNIKLRARNAIVT